VLRDIEGLSIDQTAEVLNLTAVAVKARHWRARLQLREILNEYFSNSKGRRKIWRDSSGDACIPTAVGIQSKF
jgi:hypothetical protein